jgi:hypothetical protein
MHQNSGFQMLSETQVRKARPLRHQYKLTDGGGLYLLVTPTGGRLWRYNYRFDGKHKTLALGIYPDVPLAKARARHQLARQLLAHGVDPSALKKAERASEPWRSAALRRRKRPGRCDAFDHSDEEQQPKLAV